MGLSNHSTLPTRSLFLQEPDHMQMPGGLVQTPVVVQSGSALPYSRICRLRLHPLADSQLHHPVHQNLRGSPSQCILTSAGSQMKASANPSMQDPTKIHSFQEASSTDSDRIKLGPESFHWQFPNSTFATLSMRSARAQKCGCPCDLPRRNPRSEERRTRDLKARRGSLLQPWP